MLNPIRRQWRTYLLQRRIEKANRMYDQRSKTAATADEALAWQQAKQDYIHGLIAAFMQGEAPHRSATRPAAPARP